MVQGGDPTGRAARRRPRPPRLARSSGPRSDTVERRQRRIRLDLSRPDHAFPTDGQPGVEVQPRPLRLAPGAEEEAARDSIHCSAMACGRHTAETARGGRPFARCAPPFGEAAAAACAPDIHRPAPVFRDCRRSANPPAVRRPAPVLSAVTSQRRQWRIGTCTTSSRARSREQRRFQRHRLDRNGRADESANGFRGLSEAGTGPCRRRGSALRPPSSWSPRAADAAGSTGRTAGRGDRASPSLAGRRTRARDLVQDGPRIGLGDQPDHLLPGPVEAATETGGVFIAPGPFRETGDPGRSPSTGGQRRRKPDVERRPAQQQSRNEDDRKPRLPAPRRQPVRGAPAPWMRGRPPRRTAR